VGLGLSYLRTAVDFKDARGNADVDSARLGPFVGAAWGNLFVDGSASFAWHWIDSDRLVNIPNVGSGGASGNYTALDATVDAIVGYRFKLGNHCGLTPLAEVDYTYFDQNGLIESTAPLGTNLNIASGGFSDLSSSVGARFDCQFRAEKFKLIPAVQAGWYHEYLDENSVTATFVGGATPFTVSSGLGRTDGAVWSASLTGAMTRELSLFLRYDGSWVPHDQSHTFSAGLTLNF
jgi:subtilase-type serine protease